MSTSTASKPIDHNPTVDDSPWPDDLWPLIIRGKSEDGKRWLTGAEVTVEPAVGVLYDTREPIPEGPWKLLRSDAKLRALVPAGEYQVTFEHPKGTVTSTVTVTDPLAGAETITFRDGRPIRMRPGSWDDFIIKEQPYKHLRISPGDLVFDAGAHIGTFTRDALNRGAGSVIAYEPEPVNVRLLQENVEGLPVTVVAGCLVGDQVESVQLWIDGGTIGRNALHSIKRTRGDRLPVRVPAWNFTSELYRVQPNAVKVDVEEAEWAYGWMMPDSVHSIAIELERPGSTGAEIEVINDHLLSQGFTPVKKPSAKGWATLGVWER